MDFESDRDPGQINPLREWAVLLASLTVIVIGVELLVNAAIKFGELFNTPSFLWGLTVVAAGTSVPDAFVSIRQARQGNAITSLANILGSNIFDLLVCIPAGILIAGSTTINYSAATPMMAVLTLATLLLFSFMRTDLILSEAESILLLLFYGSFILWLGLENFGILNTVPSLPPPH